MKKLLLLFALCVFFQARADFPIKSERYLLKTEEDKKNFKKILENLTEEKIAGDLCDPEAKNHSKSFRKRKTVKAYQTCRELLQILKPYDQLFVLPHGRTNDKAHLQELASACSDFADRATNAVTDLSMYPRWRETFKSKFEGLKARAEAVKE